MWIAGYYMSVAVHFLSAGDGSLIPLGGSVRDNMTVQFEDLAPLVPNPAQLPRPAMPALTRPGTDAPTGVWMPVQPDAVKQATHGVLLPALNTLPGGAEPVSRPKTAAICRTSSTKWLNSSGRMDCMPSERALSGS